MQLHTLKRKNVNKVKVRVGRGGKRGKTAGRGTKGQHAHGGHGIRPEMRDIIKKIPKLRGHGKNRARGVNAEKAVPVGINVNVLEASFDAGADVSPRTLVAAKVVRARGGKAPLIKILGNGELSKKLNITGCRVSKSAEEKIKKAGGSVAV